MNSLKSSRNERRLFSSYFWLRLLVDILVLGGITGGLFLLSIPAPLVDFDTREFHPLSDGFDLGTGPVGVPLELSLE